MFTFSQFTCILDMGDEDDRINLNDYDHFSMACTRHMVSCFKYTFDYKDDLSNCINES